MELDVDLTWTQDPGFVTEVISGAFFQPLGRSSSHQLWSSAMVLAPAIRGLFGVEVDALHRTLQLQPHLPASWDSAELDNVRVGDDLYTVTLKRERGSLMATVRSPQETVLCLTAQPETAMSACHDRAATAHTLSLPLPPVEVSFNGQQLPEVGATTSQPRVIEESYQADNLSLTMEGIAGTTAELSLRRNSERLQSKGDTNVKVDGAQRVGDKLKIVFPPGSGFVSQRIRISWPR